MVKCIIITLHFVLVDSYYFVNINLKNGLKKFRNLPDQLYKGNTTNKYLTDSNSRLGDLDLRSTESLKMTSYNKIKS